MTTAHWIDDTDTTLAAVQLRPSRRCACQGGPQMCSPCAAGDHEGHFDLSGRENDLLGPSPGRTGLAKVWLADRLCQRPCACPTCHPLPAPQQLSLDITDTTGIAP